MNLRNNFAYALRAARPSTWKSAIWLLRLMIPISLAVTLLGHFGVLEWIAGYLNPLFMHLGLPGTSAVVFMSGAAAGTYAGVAAMMSIHMTMREATIIAIMIGICHSLPMECSVVRKTGSSFWKMGLIRIIMAFVCAFYLNMVLPDINEQYMYIGAAADSSLSEVMLTWVISQVKLTCMVFGIIYCLMVLQRLIEVYGLLKPLSNFFAPLMTVFGLPRSTAYLWLVGNVLGLSYGAAVMLELQDKGIINRKDTNDMNYHLIMNHSMLEDTLVFAVTGISAIWILTTRMLFALIVVWTRKLLKSLF